MTTRGPSPWTLASLAVALLLGSVEPSSAQTRNLILLATHAGPSELVVVVDDTAYVAGGDTLRIVDVSNPSAPVEWSTYTAPDRIYGLHANGDRVYLAVGLEGLQIIDVSSPTTPRLVGRHVTPGHQAVVPLEPRLRVRVAAEVVVAVPKPVAPQKRVEGTEDLVCHMLEDQELGHWRPFGCAARMY